MDNITPRDAAETATLSVGARITAAIGIIGTAFTTVLAAIGGLDWITANLPLLLTGLGSLASGGIVSYIAVRRMRADKVAKVSAVLLIAMPALLMAAGCICRKAWLRLAVLILTIPALTGCVAIRADSDGDGAAVWAFGWGAESAANLANVAVTGPGSQTNEQTGVSFDSGGGSQNTSDAIRGIIQLGAALAPALAGVPAASAITAVSASPETDSAPVAADEAETEAKTEYSSDGYNGTPGASGEGVYGRPSCSRCRAYKAAHPDIAMINIDTASNRSDLWAALRLRGYTGSSISLPVAVTATSYTAAAK